MGKRQRNLGGTEKSFFRKNEEKKGWQSIMQRGDFDASACVRAADEYASAIKAAAVGYTRQLEKLEATIVARGAEKLAKQEQDSMSRAQAIEQRMNLERQKRIADDDLKFATRLSELDLEGKQLASREQNIRGYLEMKRKDLAQERAQFEKEMADFKRYEVDECVKINVGGRIFQTTRSTLTKYPDSFFNSLLSGRFNLVKGSDGAIFIDRSGDHFEYVLEFLRDGIITLTEPSTALQARLRREFDFFSLPLPDELEPANLPAKQPPERRQAKQEVWVCPDRYCGYQRNGPARTHCYKCDLPQPGSKWSDSYESGFQIRPEAQVPKPLQVWKLRKVTPCSFRKSNGR